MPADKEPLVGLDEIARLLEGQEGPPGARRRPASPRSARRWMGIVAAGALVVGSALGFGLGSSLTPSGNAAGPSGVGFVPSSGWRVLQSGGDATPLRPALAIASNVRLDPEDDARGIRTSSGLPYATLLGLPPQGVVIVATFTVPNADAPPDPSYPRKSLPLELRDATSFVQNSTQIRPQRPLGEYELRAHVNHRDAVIHFYFGVPRPTDAMLTEAQRQLDGLVVEPTRSTAQLAQRALPSRTDTTSVPTRSSTPVAGSAKVIDRTLTCTTGFGKGIRNVDVLARSAFRNTSGKLDGLGQVVISTPGEPNRPLTFSPTLAGATAGWPAPEPFKSGALGFSPKLCKSARANVRLSSRGLGVGGEASVFGEDVTCPTPGKVVIRVRAMFLEPAKLVLTPKKDYLSADARIKRAQVAVRTPDGKPIAYGEVLDSGKAILFTSGRCV